MMISSLAKKERLQILLGHSGILNDQSYPTLERFLLNVLILEVIYVYNINNAGELSQLINRHVSVSNLSKWNLE